MKRFSLPLIAALLILCSCGSAEAKETSKPKTAIEVVTGWGDSDGYSFREFVVNGKHCIQMDRGLSCDWNKQGE